METDSQYMLLDEKGDYLTLQKIFERVQHDPKRAVLVVSSVMVSSDNFRFLMDFTSEQTMVDFVNMFDVKTFIRWADWYLPRFDGKILAQLSPEKIKKWIGSKTYATLVKRSYAKLLKKFILDGLVKIGTKLDPHKLMNTVLAKITQKENQKKNCVELMEIAELLLYVDETFDASLIEIKSLQISNMMVKYYMNKCNMMAMELKIKERSISGPDKRSSK
jgi:hypothetical protein